MNILKISVSGYSKLDPCKLVRKTFYVRDAAEFGVRVLEWEQEYQIMEWSKDNRGQ